MTAITVTDLTTGVVDGTGVFDGLMKATNAHIQVEYQKNRIKGLSMPRSTSGPCSL